MMFVTKIFCETFNQINIHIMTEININLKVPIQAKDFGLAKTVENAATRNV